MRDAPSLNRSRDGIVTNPMRWELGQENPANRAP
jgi:hypothetical protein